MKHLCEKFREFYFYNTGSSSTKWSSLKQKLAVVIFCRRLHVYCGRELFLWMWEQLIELSEAQVMPGIRLQIQLSLRGDV